MEKAYNLSKLFQEDEFDVERGCKRCDTKEAYFSVLYRFTLDSEDILKRCQPEQYHSGNIEIDQLTQHIETLQRTLANIGAVKLAWNIQSLNPLLEKKQYEEYVKMVGEILLDVDKLRNRIVSAEKVESEPNRIHAKDTDDKTTDGIKRLIKPQHSGFTKLSMLIDNFELESALETAAVLMQRSYTPKIDEMLRVVYESLKEFNFPKSSEEAQEILELDIFTKEMGKPMKKTILAIDDMPDVLRTIKAMLKGKYTVVGIADYESAIKFLRSNTADLILLDIEMPGLDGFAMTQLFRKLPEYAKTPIIFLTGNVSNEYIKTAINLGARDFIKKPVDLAVLVNKLESAFLQS